jgi:hypothetical protein
MFTCLPDQFRLDGVCGFSHGQPVDAAVSDLLRERGANDCKSARLCPVGNGLTPEMLA